MSCPEKMPAFDHETGTFAEQRNEAGLLVAGVGRQGLEFAFHPDQQPEEPEVVPRAR